MSIAEVEMTSYTHLTAEELIRVLTTRDDLSDLEHELLDRLILAVDELASFEKGSDGNHP